MVLIGLCLQIARQNLGYEVEALDSKMRAHVSRTTENQAFLKQYEADRRSIYVAGLPADVDEDEVVRYFRTVGDVVGVEIIRRRSMDNSKTPLLYEIACLKVVN